MKCIYIKKCSDYPEKCNECKFSKKKSYFKHKDKYKDIKSKTIVFGSNPQVVKECSGYLYSKKYNNYKELEELCKWVRVTPRDVLNKNSVGDIQLHINVAD